jgi:pyruvate dehydrogenase (quinone)
MGVRKIFGFPGDGINGVFGALNRANGKIELIQARHEKMDDGRPSMPPRLAR